MQGRGGGSILRGQIKNFILVFFNQYGGIIRQVNIGFEVLPKTTSKFICQMKFFFKKIYLSFSNMKTHSVDSVDSTESNKSLKHELGLI